MRPMPVRLVSALTENVIAERPLLAANARPACIDSMWWTGSLDKARELAAVKHLGFHCGQGYLLSPPLAAADMDRLVVAELAQLD